MLGIAYEEALVRAETDLAVRMVSRAIENDKANFGGLYRKSFADIDGLVILYVGENAGGPAVDALLPRRMPVEWIRVHYSLLELERIQHEIVSRHMHSLRLAWVAIDVLNNRVEVATRMDVAQVQSALSSHGSAAYVTAAVVGE